MQSRHKKILLGFVGVVLALVIGVVALLASAFSGNAPIRDGAAPQPGVSTVAMGFVSAFIVDADPGSVVLIDTGSEPSGAAIVRALRARQLGPDAVRAILITHGHGDHTGAVRAFPRADVFALASERALVEGTAASHSPVGRLRGPHATGIRLTRALADGEVVNVGSLAVRVFAVPGHTGGSAAYLARDTLFLGDAARGTPGGAVRGPVWIFSEDQAQGVSSLRALAARLARDQVPVHALAFAHSGPVVAGDALTRLASAR